MTVPINHFDRGKPFYPMVMNYVLQLLGLKELSVRGLIGVRKITDDDITKAAGSPSQIVPPEILGKTRTEIEGLLGPLQLRSEFSGRHVDVDADEAARELVRNHVYLLPHYIRAAGSLLVLAHETTKGRSYRDNGPLWEFLRHCRNGATHNGLFHFRHGEPSRPATRGRFSIGSSLHGTPVLKNETGKGLLSPGDPIRLLWDIEQAYPGITI
jgi:hypothetical protein